MVADVPVGILLSGGVDSSLVTAMAVRKSSRVKTFTVSFPGQGAYDEAAHARLIAEHFGTDHTELVAEPVGADLLPKLAHQFDEPLTDSSLIPTYLVSRLVRQHCTVALGGDGGDELFGGYGNYSRLLRMQQRSGRVPHPLRQLVAAGAEFAMPVGVRGRGWLQGLDADLDRSLPLARHYFDETTRRRLLPGRGALPLLGEALQRRRVPDAADIVQRATRMDFADYLPEDVLVKVDRASMLNSIEMRAPMLDHRVIEFAFGRVPSSLKATLTDKKILLKRLAGRLLPPTFDKHRKQGFSIPMAEWLRAGPFRELFHDVLLDSTASFDRRTVQGLLDGQDRGRSNGERLFGLLMFELWRRDYGATL
jgi:asparagine synthase (glutamine-hydrolysing)